MYYVYCIESISHPHKTYIGCTNNLKERLAIHNRGESVFTATYRPWKIVMYVALDDAQTAYDFEKYLKTHSGRAFIQKRLLPDGRLKK